MKLNFPFLLLSLSVLLIAAGCGRKVSFGGKVTFSDDGAPLTSGTVFFESPTLAAQGKINTDGTYTVGTDKMADGLPAGTYQVYLVGTEHTEIKAMPDGKSQSEIRTPVIDPKYSSAGTSGLSVTVGGGTKKFDIQVERYVP